MSEWINIKERLPEEDENVLVSYDRPYGEVTIARLWRDKEGGIHWNILDEYSIDPRDVRAWMPLPEPYEKGE